MNMEQLFLIGLSAATGLLGWFARELYSAVQQLREDLAELEVRIGTDYVRYDRLRDALEPIKAGIDEIKESLRHKADKP